MKILKSTIGILALLIGAFQINAQDVEKEFKIKIVKEEDGETITIDTVISGDEDFNVKDFLKKYNVDIESEEFLDGDKKMIKMKIDIDEDIPEGKKLMFVTEGDDKELILKHLEGDSLKHWHSKEHNVKVEKIIKGDKEMMFIHTDGDANGDVIIKHFDGDSLIHWHEKDGDHKMKKHIVVEIDEDGEHKKDVRIIKISDNDDEKYIIKEFKDDSATWHVKHKDDFDGKHKKIEVKVEVDGDVITIEEIESDEDGKKVTKKKKVKKGK